MGRFQPVLRRLQASAFDDLRGAEASITLPVGERLLNEIVAAAMPSSGPVREVHVTPLAGDRLAVRAKIGASALVPALPFTLVIDRQPVFPSAPVLILKLETSGLLLFAGPLLRSLGALPHGIRLDQDRIHVDLPRLLESRPLSFALDHVTELGVHTVEGAVTLTLRAAVGR